jgi:hypothetical protein
MSKAKTIRVRQMTEADFAFVRELASKQPNFTIPPPYVLWLLQKVDAQLCMLAEDLNSDAAGYLLAVPMKKPAKSIFIWQLASARPETVITEAIMDRLRELAIARGIKSISFSARPNSAAFRRIRRLVGQYSATGPSFLSALAPGIAPGEEEFNVALKQR